MRRVVTAFVVFATVALGACIIGPKQDDPDNDLLAADTGTSMDASFSSDTSSGTTIPDGAGGNADTSLPPAPPDADAASDAAGDANDAPSDVPSDVASDVIADAPSDVVDGD